MIFKQEIVEKLKVYAEELFGAKKDELTAETRFKEDLKCKSLHLTQIATKLEDDYEVEVPYADINRCITFADLADFMDKALS